MESEKKITITVSVDNTAWQWHKARGVNVSKTVSDYLVALMGQNTNTGQLTELEKKVSGLKEELAKADVERAACLAQRNAKLERDRQAAFKVDIMQLLDLAKLRMADKLAEKQYFELIRYIKSKYCLSIVAVLDYVEGRRVV